MQTVVLGNSRRCRSAKRLAVCEEMNEEDEGYNNWSRADVLEDKHTLCYVQACAVIYMALANGKSLANMNMQMFTYG